MTDDTPRRFAGVADEVLVAPPAVPRGAAGRLLPGARLNPLGRPSGRPNDTTIAAAAEMRAHAQRAVARLAQAIDDPNSFVALAACKALLERTVSKDGDSGPVDDSFVRYLTPRQVRLIDAWITKAKAKAFEELGDNPDGVLADGDLRPPMSNREAWDELHTIDVSPKRDAFASATPPAPEPEQPETEQPTPNDDDEYEEV